MQIVGFLMRRLSLYSMYCLTEVTIEPDINRRHQFLDPVEAVYQCLVLVISLVTFSLLWYTEVSHGNEQGFDQNFATAGPGKYPGFALYRQKGL